MATKEKKKMTEAEFNALLKKKNPTYLDIAGLDNEYFPRYAVAKGFGEWLEKALDRTEIFHHKAKGDTPAYDEEVAISALTLRRDFAQECLKIAKKAPAENKVDWHLSMKDALAAAMAKK